MTYTPRPDCQIPNLAAIYEEHLPKDIGRFVEVGAHDGISFSNTVFLAEAGWHGLYVEPEPVAAHHCRVNHRSHIGVQVAEIAISDREGEAELYTCGSCSTLNWDKNAIDWGCKKERTIKVKLTTLDNLLTQLKWTPRFDLLVIDVENHEPQVLRGFTIGRWLPKLVIIEAHERDPAWERSFKAGPISGYFGQMGYKKIFADHINSIFLR
jgi:FkbM family methyltransferase